MEFGRPKLKQLKKENCELTYYRCLIEFIRSLGFPFRLTKNTIKITVQLKSSFFSCFKLENVQRALEPNTPVPRMRNICAAIF